MYIYTIGEGAGHPLFLFTTDSGLIYNVRFETFPYPFHNIEPIRSISIGCDSKDKILFDVKVGMTVCAIIDQYLSSNPNELLSYVCDDLDNRGASRQRKFSCWHSKYGHNGYTISPQTISSPDGTVIFTCLLFSPNFFNEQQLIDKFTQEIAILENHKQ